MASSSKAPDSSKSLPLHRKKIRVRKLMSDDSHSTSSSGSIILEDVSSEEYIPLAARDSKWVGLNVCNSDLNKYSNYESSIEEVVILEVNEEEELPIYSLFPLLRDTPPDKRKLVTSNESTSDITKLLVGQKPDFTHMKKSKRVSPVKLSLPKLEELPNEEKVSDSKLSKHSSRAFGQTPSFSNRASESSNSSKETHYDDESDLEYYKKVKKVKRYKKKPRIIPFDDDTESSYSGLVEKSKQNSSNAGSHSRTNQMVTNRTSSVVRRHSAKIIEISSNASLGDEES